MKTVKNIYSKAYLLLGMLLITAVGCERDLSEDAVLATFGNNAEVFIDGFSAGLEYLPFAGSVLNAFSVDNDTKYSGSASMRFDVPNVGDPLGAFAGAIFPDNGGRDLSGYDALTFWAKGTRPGVINEVGFGQDFGENKFQVATSIQLTTNWRQYTIPIPDPSRLTQEKGLFWYAEGPENNEGYTFWVDDVKFEKLGTIAQPRPAILNGNDETSQTFIGATTSLTGLTQTFHLASGQDQTVGAAPSYFEFTSSNTGVATISELGVISVIGAGTTVITATLNGVDAAGSLTIESLGNFTQAPMPTRDAANVISIFSDAYTNDPVDYYNGYWAPFQTTQGQNDININGDNIIKYSQLNFVGIQFADPSPTINASQMTHFHIDVQAQNPVNPGDYLKIRIVDIGADNSFGGSDDSSYEINLTNVNLTAGQWYSVDIPFAAMNTLTSRANLAQIVFVSDATITDLFVDNVYFYEVPTTPTIAAPTPTDPAANVISLFSDAYTDVTVDTWRTPWSSADFQDITVAGNATKEYSNLDFVGIETTSSTIDASAMTHIHLDVWSANFSSFSIKLVDFGADGAFGGGDDTEHQVNYTAPAQGQWISYDIPLSDFVGLGATAHMAQYILVAQPSGSAKVYIDNMYFHN